ncbi:MAG TPA: 16S rRNA (guanine(527)-N(7))-methyltransferase RsmG [Stellaceae bacterium]|nr:16S rRNA (guanine(527)-N(7))-methyltransferase RsmG [Stellaceae bacterium]
MTPEAFAASTDVSRETLDRLRCYADLLVKWNARINLVGPATLTDLWRRHILDSAQLVPLLPETARIVVDLGSGAGLPGLILAALTRQRGMTVHLIEADQRKCAFLREAARLTEVPVRIHACRFDAAPSIAADVVTARAVAPLSALLGHAERFLTPSGACLFLKGGQSAHEVREAQAHWPIRVRERPSHSDPTGVILQIQRERAVQP